MGEFSLRMQIPGSIQATSEGPLAKAQSSQGLMCPCSCHAGCHCQFAVAAYGAKLYVYASKATCFGGALHLGGRAALRELVGAKLPIHAPHSPAAATIKDCASDTCILERTSPMDPVTVFAFACAAADES